MSESEKPESSWAERKRSIKHKWHAPFILLIEWPCEWISYWLGQCAFFDILGYAGRLTVLVAVVFYIKGCPERDRQAQDQLKAKHYQAWQVIIAARGQRVSGGRKDALEDLYADGVSLVGLDISNAYLPGLNLEGAELYDVNAAEAVLTDANLAGAKLHNANFFEADFNDVNLTRADLTHANLADANLPHACLVDAQLWFAHLAGAVLTDANLARAKLGEAELSGAILARTNLEDAALMGANLIGADLHGANLSKANLRNAKLSGAVLSHANLHSAKLARIENWKQIKSIKRANIFGVEHAPCGFEDWAMGQGARQFKDEQEWENWLLESQAEEYQSTLQSEQAK